MTRSLFSGVRNLSIHFVLRAAVCASVVATALAACGGGGSDAGGSPFPPTFTLTVSKNGVSTVLSDPAGIQCGPICSSTFEADSVVTLVASAALGQRFVSWGGACSGTATTCRVRMDSSRQVTAVFQPQSTITPTLTVSVSGSGAVTSLPSGINCTTACTADFIDGTSVVLTATPAAGHQFSGWAGSCSGTSTTCVIAMNQDRTIAASFTPVAAPVWSSPMQVESSNSFDVPTRVLTAIGSTGHAMVLWEQSDGSPDGSVRKAWSRRYVANQGWGPAVVIPGLAAGSPLDKLVEGILLMDSRGTATWIRPSMQTRRATVDNGWGPAFTPDFVSNGPLTSAALAADGHVHALISGRDVYHNKLPPGGAWQGWTRVNANTTSDAREAAIALSTNGTGFALWREKNPGEVSFSLKAARYLPQSGGWQTPQTLDNSTDPVIGDSPPRVAMDASGNAIAVWHQGESLYHSTFNNLGGWASAVQVDAGLVNSQFPARIQLAMTATGRAVVTWRSNIYAMKAMQFAPGSGFSAPVLVTPYSGDPALGLDTEGSAVVVYFSPAQWPNPVAGADVYSRRLSWGVGWSDQAAVEPLDGLGANLTASFNGVGQGIAAWVRPDNAESASRQSLWVSLLR